MQKFVVRPSVDLIPGVRVYKDTVLEYEADGIKQTVKNLVFETVAFRSGDNYKSTATTTITLSEGDILIFEDGGRGYVLPLNGTVCSIKDAIDDLECIKELGEE